MATRRRGYLVVALGCLVVALVLLAVAVGWADARAPARPASGCLAAVDGATAERAAHELVGYSSALQSGVLTDATMGHVQNLVELANALMEAPRVGCDPSTALPSVAPLRMPEPMW